MSSNRARVLFQIPSASTLKYCAPAGAPAAFSWKFGTHHAYSFAAAQYIENDNHPFNEISKRRWAAKREPLWVSFVATKIYGQTKSRCVRSWLCRRLRASFHHSLQKNGYAPDGTPLEGSPAKNQLYGTVLFYAERPMLLMAQKVLEEQTDKVVNHIIRRQRERRSLRDWSSRPRYQSRDTRGASHGLARPTQASRLAIPNM